jgi:hypothetical protein
MPTFSMGMPVTSHMSPEKRIEILESTVEELMKRLAWFTARLDSKNVKRLDTNETVIKSADGTTEIVGPVLVQKDDAGTTRLRQGYDAVTGDFVYELFNATAVKTVGIDSNGNATYTGTITGSTVTGGTIQTAATGSRIVITGNTLKTYREILGVDYLMGPAWGTSLGGDYGDLSFYDQDVETFRIENSIGTGWTLRPMNGGATYVGYGGANTYASGDWSFVTANSVAGLVTNTALSGIYAHSHTVQIG